MRAEACRRAGIRSVLISMAALTLAACGDPAVNSPAANPPRPTPIILISLDTVRADHLSCYGYERKTSPALDAFARQATLYRHAISTAPWTLPAHASLFTGLYPFEHGAHTVEVENLSDPLVNNVDLLDSSHVTLAEALRDVGYRTAAFVANDVYLTPDYGMDQGFSLYDNRRGPALEMNERIFDWLEVYQDQPFFLFLNFMDAHNPYNVAKVPGFLEGWTIPEDARKTLHQLYFFVFEGKELPDGLLRTVVAQYDLGIRNLDRGLEGLFAKLKELELFEEALILITSDHGELLAEHRLVEHSKDVYEPVLHVPLLIKEPHQSVGRVEAAPISLVHLPALLLATAGVHSLPAEAAFDEHPWPASRLLAQNYYSRLKDLRSPWGERFRRVRSVLYQSPHKLIQSSDGQHELYALDNDPQEQTNLHDQQKAIADELARELRRLFENGRAWTREGGRRTLTAEEVKNLAELGYH